MEKPSGFVFTPGQFVLFDVPLLNNAHDIQPRAYSIASAPSEPDLRFAMKIVSGGRASTWMEQCVEKGTEISFKGPFGIFTLDRNTRKPYLFVATGTGVAPFRSQMKWLLEEERDNRPLTLLFGLLKKEDLFWKEELRKMEQKYKNLTVHLSFLSGEADWHGDSGSIQERLPALVSNPSDISVYLCGDPSTVQELKTLCLSTLNAPKEDVHVEAYV